MKTEYEKAIDAQEPVAWITEGGDVTRSYALAVERSFNRAPPSPLPSTARAAVAELIEKSAAALHYMRLHKYADQAWADDLAEALARVRGGRADD